MALVGGLSWFWGPVRAHPEWYPALGRGRMLRAMCPSAPASGLRWVGTGVSAMGKHILPGPPRLPTKVSGEPSRAGDTFLAALPGEGRAKSISLELRGPDSAAEAAVEGVNGAEWGPVPPTGGVVWGLTPPSPLPPTSPQAAPSLFVRFRKAAAIKMHCSISAPSAPEPEQNPCSCLSQQP